MITYTFAAHEAKAIFKCEVPLDCRNYLEVPIVLMIPIGEEGNLDKLQVKITEAVQKMVGELNK